MTNLDTYPWAAEAQTLLVHVAKMPRTANAMLVLRHSQREEPKQLGEINQCALTAEGRQAAREFGKGLPKGWNYLENIIPDH